MKIVTKNKVELNTEITFTVNEEEARALLALTIYGSKSFLETFYTKLGRTYMEPYSKGLISVLDTLKKKLPAPLGDIDKIRAFIKNRDENS